MQRSEKCPKQQVSSSQMVAIKYAADAGFCVLRLQGEDHDYSTLPTTALSTIRHSRNVLYTKSEEDDERVNAKLTKCSETGN
jgi:hypothetical protein